MIFRVLVVDDEPDVVELFRRRFRRQLREGIYAFHFASSGEDALAQLDDEIEPALMLILSDINMPGMSGIDLLRRVKEIRPELPIALITAYGDEERRRLAFELGAVDFLAKPIDFGYLKTQLFDPVAEGKSS